MAGTFCGPMIEIIVFVGQQFVSNVAPDTQMCTLAPGTLNGTLVAYWE